MAVQGWQFVLAQNSVTGTIGTGNPATDPNFNTVNDANIGVLDGARGKTLELILNRPGSAKFTLSLEDPIASEVVEGTTCVKCFRDGVNRWSGMVWNTTESLANRTLEVTCVGWLELLNYRLIRDSQEASASFNSMDGAIIARDHLLDLANKQLSDVPTNSSGVPTGDPAWYVPTGISAGTITGTPIADVSRNRVYTRWTNIGQAIQELSDVEAGFDYEVDSDNPRGLNIYYAQIILGSTVYGKGNVTSSLFTIGKDGANLSEFTPTTDTSNMRNRVVATGRYGSVASSGQFVNQQTYGIFEEQASLSDVVDSVGGPSILGVYANAEVVVRGRPQITYSMVPFPWSEGSNVPRLFIDYDIGDIVKVLAYGGRFPIEGVDGKGQAIRVYGASITIDEEGNERITAIQTTPA